MSEEIGRQTDVASLVRAFDDGDVDVREAVMLRLPALSDSRVHHLLQLGLRDQSIEVATAALTGIAAQGADAGMHAATELLRAWVHPGLATTHLLASGADVGPIFLEILDDEDLPFQKRLQGLAELAPKVLMTRASEWIDRPEVLERCNAARVLAQIGETAAAGPLLAQIWDGLLVLVNDTKPAVCAAALLACQRTHSPLWPDLAAQAAEHGAGTFALAAVELLGESGLAEHTPRLLAGFHSRDPNVRAAVIRALGRLDIGKQLELARRCLRDVATQVAVAAIEALGQVGTSQDLEALVGLETHTKADVRSAAVQAVVQLDPAEGVRIARGLLPDPQTVRVALSTLEAALPDGHVSAVIEQLSKARGYAATALLGHVVTHDVTRIGVALRQVLQSREQSALEVTVPFIVEHGGEARRQMLSQLLGASNGKTRRAAFDAWLRVFPEERTSLAVGRLEDPYWEVRLAAVNIAAELADPTLLDDLVQRARDSSANVRKAALRAVSVFDDEHVFSELVSSLHDVDDSVRKEAKRILDGGASAAPVLARFDSSEGAPPVWEQLEGQVDAINLWAASIGQELLGKPVTVHQYRQGLGRTHGGRASKDRVEIEVSDLPLTSGHPHGEEIMRGLALHEIGHHLTDIGVRGHSAMRGIARSERLDDIYCIIIDERLERIMRSRRPEWGVYFDRLASYAFAQTPRRVPVHVLAEFLGRRVDDVATDVRAGRLPGELSEPRGREGGVVVSLKPNEVLAVPGAIGLTSAFLWCLRCGLDPARHPDPRVEQAVGMIGGDLRSMNHARVLALSREVAKLLEHEDGERGYETALMSTSAMQRLAALGMLPDGAEVEGVEIRASSKTDPSPSPSTAPPNPRQAGRGGQSIDLGPNPDFPALTRREVLVGQAAAETKLVGSIRKHVRRLRPFFERLGVQTVEEYASRRGGRLDYQRARQVAFRPITNLLVSVREEHAPDAYIGVLIDRSGSMNGHRLERAKRFAALAAESARGLRGIEGHVCAFDGTTFFDLGDFQRHAIASLTAGGGNNDAGALKLAADRALASRKQNRLLIMISDGSPSSCTVTALRNLVGRLTKRHGIICAQAAVAHLDEIAFPHFVDLSRYQPDEAISRFGSLLMRLTQHWR